MNELKQAFVTLYPTLTSYTEQMHITAYMFIFLLPLNIFQFDPECFWQAVTEELLRGIIMIY